MPGIPRMNTTAQTNYFRKSIIAGYTLAAISILAPLADPFLLVGRVVVRSIYVGFVLWLIAMFLLWSQHVGDRKSASYFYSKWKPNSGQITIKPKAAPLIAFTVLTLLYFGTSWLWLQLFTGDWFLLDPISPNGCRVLVEEQRFLFSGSGDVYIQPDHNAIIRLIRNPIGEYDTDDGYGPITSGNFQLEWQPTGGTLRLLYDVDGVWPDQIAIPCN